MDEKPSAVGLDLVQVDSDDGDGEFTDTLHMTRAHYDATFRGIGGIISPWGLKFSNLEHLSQNPSETLHSTLKIKPSEVEQEQPASVPPPTAPEVHSLSPITPETNRVRTYSQPTAPTKSTVRRRTSSDSKLRRVIIQDISIKVTSALQTALEGLMNDEPTSDDSFEHIPELDPIESSSPPTAKPKDKTIKKDN